MLRFILSLPILVASFAFSAQAEAGTLTRTFVSSTGVDTNPCTVTAPCATFAAAYAAVVTNGIVAALDPGKYGALTISTPVTIDGNGWAAITAQANNYGITVTATSGNVVLRGLTIDGAEATGTNGIGYFGGASLAIDGCTVRNMTTTGLVAGTSNSERVFAVTNSSFVNDGTGVQIASAGAGSVLGSFDGILITGNDTNPGLLVTGGSDPIDIAVTNSTISNNAAGGVKVSASNAGAYVYLTNVQVSNNSAFGLQAAGASATIYLGQSTVTGNSTQGYNISTGGVINTFGDNYIADNGSNNGSLTTAGQQ
jgi:parallel beta helix pectate lyase-like protein